MAEQKAANLLNLSPESSTTVEAPSQCLLRAHSLSPSSSWRRQRQRQSSRPRASTATARSAGNAPTGTTTITWWPTGGGSNGLMGMLQRALCSGGTNQRDGGQYRTVLTRESPDSGLELDRLESGRVQQVEEAEADGSDGEDAKETEDGADEAVEAKKQQQRPNSLGRLLSSLLPSRPSLSHSMFDFPSPSPLGMMGPQLDPNGYAQSPISQLSRANAALMQENQQLVNRLEELEHSLRDHVAHLNSVYFTLHQRHGFDALQLPDGELVQLSRFKGPEVVLLTFVRSPNSTEEVPVGSPQQKNGQAALQQLANRRHRLQQQIRHKLPPNATNGAQQQGSHSPSISGGSSCSMVSAASSDSSLDPVEMFHQLCIRPKGELAEDDKEHIQAYLHWLKSAGREDASQGDEQQEAVAKLRAQQVQAQVQQANGCPQSCNSSPLGRVHFSAEENGQSADARKLLNGWRSARSETAGSSAAGIVENNGQQQLCPQLSEPNSARAVSPRPSLGGQSKSQRIRTQYPSNNYLQTRRGTASGSGIGYATSALISGNHHAHEERSPRRGGIGLVAACRNTMRNNFEHRAVKRNLI